MEDDTDLLSSSPSNKEKQMRNDITSNIAVPSFSYDPEGFLRTAAEIMHYEAPICDCATAAECQRRLEPVINANDTNSGSIIPDPTKQVATKFSRKITPEGEELMDMDYSPSTSFSQRDTDQGNDAISQSSVASSYSNTTTNKNEMEPRNQGIAAESDCASVNKDNRTRRYPLLKPLNAYNYFFRDERDNMVRGPCGPDGSLPPPISDWSEERKRKLLREHWYVDPLRGRRKHRKKEGAIPFKSLASLVGVRWKSLPVQGRLFYDDVARLDLLYYKKHSEPGNNDHDYSELDDIENPPEATVDSKCDDA